MRLDGGSAVLWGVVLMADLAAVPQWEQALKAGSALPPNATVEQAEVVANDLPRFKKLLEAANVYAQKATEFIRLEAQTWVDITKLCFIGIEKRGNKSYVQVIGDFTYDQKIIMSYVGSISDEERHALPDLCANEGKRVVSYAKQYYRGKAEEEKIERAEEEVDFICQQFNKNGRVNISGKFDRYRLSDFSKSAISDRTKDRLITCGAVGIGNGEYVSPDKCDVRELCQALKIRINSIIADIRAYNLLVEKLPKTQSWLDSYTDMAVAFRAIDSFDQARKNREKKWFLKEFKKMANSEGVYDYHCDAAYKNLKEALDEFIADETDGMSNARLLTDEYTNKATWIIDALEEVAKKRKAKHDERMRAAMEALA